VTVFQNVNKMVASAKLNINAIQNYRYILLPSRAITLKLIKSDSKSDFYSIAKNIYISNIFYSLEPLSTQRILKFMFLYNVTHFH